MMATQSKTINNLAVIGLALGAIFGPVGTFVSQTEVRALLWAIDATGLVMATALLCLKYFRLEKDIVAGGFLVFAIGESVLLSGAAGGPAYAAGVALWSLALLLICIPRQFALPVRIVGILGAVLFAITALRMFLGEELTPVSSPLPFFAYPFLVFTLLGWIWSLLQEQA
jgi:hypothetical protein